MNEAEPKNPESYWHDKAVRQGLTLATLCDMVLGEDATQRDDETLIRSVRVLLSRACAPISGETWHIQALEHARELLRDICLQQVNGADEAEKWLRAYGWPNTDAQPLENQPT